MKKYLLSVILIALSFSAFCQIHNVNAVRFVNVHDSTTMTSAPFNGMIYYNNQSNKFRIYENSVWHDWGTGGGGGVPTSRTISTTAPLTGGGDLSANRTFAITQANTSTDGYLSSTDWDTFNDKLSSLIDGSGTSSSGNAIDLGGSLSQDAEIDGVGSYRVGLGTNGGRLLSSRNFVTEFFEVNADDGVGNFGKFRIVPDSITYDGHSTGSLKFENLNGLQISVSVGDGYISNYSGGTLGLDVGGGGIFVNPTTGYWSLNADGGTLSVDGSDTFYSDRMYRFLDFTGYNHGISLFDPNTEIEYMGFHNKNHTDPNVFNTLNMMHNQFIEDSLDFVRNQRVVEYRGRQKTTGTTPASMNSSGHLYNDESFGVSTQLFITGVTADDENPSSGLKTATSGLEIAVRDTYMPSAASSYQKNSIITEFYLRNNTPGGGGAGGSNTLLPYITFGDDGGETVVPSVDAPNDFSPTVTFFKDLESATKNYVTFKVGGYAEINNLKFNTQPTLNDTIAHVAVIDYTTGEVKRRRISSIVGGGSYWNAAGSTTLTGHTFIDGPYSLQFGGITSLSSLVAIANAITLTSNSSDISISSGNEFQVSINGDAGTMGEGLISDGAGNVIWGTTSGGITNGAASNELMKSNGTNAVASGFFSSGTSSFTFGSASISDAVKTFSVVNSTSDAAFALSSQGATTFSANGTTALTLNPNSVELSGSATGTRTNSSLTGGTPTYGSGSGVVFIKSALTNPSGSPTSGGLLYGDASDSDKLKWKTPAGTVYDLTDNGGGGSGDMILASTQTNTGAKTFLDNTLLLRNVANTFSSRFTNAATAARVYTLKDADGTIAFTSDITGTNSGTNTGDQTITLTGAVTGSGTGSFATTIATPGTLSQSSTNSTATAHTHAITSSNSPGAAASILATDASGHIGTTGSRIVKGWYVDLTVTNAIAGSITGNAATVTTNANLTGDITSSGNATTYNNIVPSAKGGAGSINGILKANGSGVTSLAVAGTDYMAPSSAEDVSGVKSFEDGTIRIWNSAKTFRSTILPGTFSADRNHTLPNNSGVLLINPISAIGDIPVSTSASAGTTLGVVADVAIGNVLLSGGVAAVPSYGKVGLSTHVSGNLPVANLNSGTSASGTTFWAGDATWKAPFTLTTTGTSGAATFSAGTLNIPNYAGGGGSGTVTDFSAGDLSPLFTTSEATTTTTPALTFTAVNQSANTVYAGATSGGAAAPTFRAMVTEDVATPLTDSRTITGASASVQTDNLNKVYLNSASPFNFTVDQLTAGSEVVLMNINTGTITLVNGSGVTMSGTTTILQDQTAVIIYRTATAPIVKVSGGSSSGYTYAQVKSIAMKIK